MPKEKKASKKVKLSTKKVAVKKTAPKKVVTKKPAAKLPVGRPARRARKAKSNPAALEVK